MSMTWMITVEQPPESMENSGCPARTRWRRFFHYFCLLNVNLGHCSTLEHIFINEMLENPPGKPDLRQIESKSNL